MSDVKRVVVIGDTHAGGRQDAKWLLKKQEAFYDRLFRYMIQHDIKNIWHLGDLFDRRKTIYFETLHDWKRFFFNRIRDYGFHLEIIPGNHDIRFTNTRKVNALNLLVESEYSDCVTVYSTPTVVDYSGYKVAWIPWIVPDEQESTLDFLANTEATHVNGHFDIMNFEMSRNNFSTHGLDASVFSRFDRVWSGHYHKRSTQGNITYIGSPTEYTWADFADPKGFVDFDFKTMTFVDNPDTIFAQYHYDPLDTPEKIRNALDTKIAKIFVSESNRKNKKQYEEFLSFLQTVEMIDYSVVELSESLVKVTQTDADGNVIEISSDTQTILSDYMKTLVVPDHIDSSALVDMILELHKETVARQEGKEL